MSKGHNLAATRSRASDLEQPVVVTWSDVHDQLPDPEVIAADRLHLFAGDGENGPEAPDSVRRDKGLLLKWCEVNQPEMVLDDDAALIKARNRASSEFFGRLRSTDPRRRFTPAEALAYLTRERAAQ